MANIEKIKTEITTDPLGLGYSTMTDQQVADSLNGETREVIQSALSGSTIFNAIVPSEFAPLTDSQKQSVRDVFSLGDAVDVGAGTNARNVLLSAFLGGSTTRDNLIAAITNTTSRAKELNLLGNSPEIGPAHINKARSL